MGSNKSKGNSKATLVQVGVIIIGEGMSKEDAVLDAETRPGVVRYEVSPEEDYVALYGQYEAQPAPPIPA
ncbi:hypothetical protein HYT05_00585 [Candidatus Kaiserbacteria bacterium]|nr:hypothetical protein [Candidatus Kaiserbacteria bacterium]